MDFYTIKERLSKAKGLEVYPDFRVCRSKDLMVQGKQFFAVWDAEKSLWSTDEYDVQRLIDQELAEYRDKMENPEGHHISVKYLGDFSTSSWLQFRNYVGHISDNAHELDSNLTFSNTEVSRTDYASKRLPYPLAAGDISAFEIGRAHV